MQRQPLLSESAVRSRKSFRAQHAAETVPAVARSSSPRPVWEPCLARIASRRATGDSQVGDKTASLSHPDCSATHGVGFITEQVYEASAYDALRVLATTSGCIRALPLYRAIRGFHVPPAKVRRVRCLLSTGRRMGHEGVMIKRRSHLRYRLVRAWSPLPRVLHLD